MMGDWGNWWTGMMGSWGWPAAVGGFAIIWVLAVLFWIWMIIDCLQRPDKNFPAKGTYDKLVWIIVLLFANILGAVLYYLMVKRIETAK